MQRKQFFPVVLLIISVQLWFLSLLKKSVNICELCEKLKLGQRERITPSTDFFCLISFSRRYITPLAQSKHETIASEKRRNFDAFTFFFLQNGMFPQAL